MKKALSVLLSLTLLFSTITCMFQNAYAEPTGIITQDFETGFVQNGSKIDRDPDNIEATDKPIWSCTVKNDDTTYLNIGGLEAGKIIQYLTNIAETGMLDATKTYTLTFKYRIHIGTATATNQAVKFTLQTQTAGTSLGYAERWYNADYETEWRTATIENITPAANDLYTKLRLEGGSGAKDAVKGMTVDIDDCVFTEVVPASVTVDGKLGTAGVSKNSAKIGDTLTYTAKEYKSGAFTGWFNGQELVSSEKVYTVTYTGTQALNLTAKFEGEAIVQDFETGFTNSNVNETDVKKSSYIRNGTTDYGGYIAEETVGGVKNKFARFSNVAKWLRDLTLASDTGLLKSKDTTTYNLTFKYRVSRLVSGDADKAGVMYIQPGNNDGGSMFFNDGANGGSNINGVKLFYDSTDKTTWKTATIYGIKRQDLTGNLRLQFEATKTNNVANNELVIDVDEFVFEEYNKASAQSEGAGSAYVSSASAKTGDKVTFTATAPKGVEFYGWYDGDTKVSDDLVYSFTFDGTQKLELTAKFSGGILQNFEKISTVNTSGFERDPDGKKVYKMWSTEVLKEENGNKYLNVKDFYNLSTLSEAGKSVHYLTNAAETGLLEDSSYKVTFKYRVRKGTSETFTEATKGEKYPNGLKNGNVKVTFLPQDYKGEVPSAITNAMISTANFSVTLEYDAENEEEWKTITLFNIPRYKVDGAFADEGMLKLRITSVSGYTLDLDDFYFSPITISGDYDELENWKIYDFISEQTEYGTAVRGNIIGEGAVEAASPSKYWASITYNLDNAYLYDNADEYSIKFKTNTQYAATTINVEKNTDYVLSFKYYAPEKAIISGTLQNNLGNPKAAIASMGIVKPNGRYNYNSDDLISYVARDSAFTGPYSNRVTNYLTTINSNVDSWETLELPFNSGDLDKVAFVIQSGSNTVYLENIKLEKRKMDIPGPGEPKDKVVVDFDNNGEIELQASERMEITTAKNYEGKDSKMLHLFRKDYDTPTLFNADTAFNADKDNTFTFAVKGNTVYKVTFRAKVFKDDTFKAKDLNGDGTNENPWFAVYAHYSGWQPATRQMAYMLWGRNNTWEEYTYYLTTDEKQDVFSFTFNAGQITPEAWIDDIVVEETDFDVFKGHTEAKQETVINFDDYAVNSEYSFQLRIDAAPEKDGNKNNIAMKFLPERRESAACLNPSATRKGTDPVFAIPVKPSTLYTLSYWVYVTPDQQQGVKWFKFYYFQNPETWESEGLLDATSMSQRGEWVKFETTLVTAADQNKLHIALSANNNMPEMWLDDIALEEVLPGGAQIMDKESYCSDFYNILIDEGLVSEIESGKSGVYKVPVNNMTQYTFGATVKSAKSSSSRIFLSFDGINPMEPSEKENPVSMVINPNDEEKRYGLMFVSSNSGYVYVVVENDDGALKISDADFFRSYSLSTAQPMGFENKPLEELNRPSELIKLELLGEDDELIDDNYSDSAEDNSEDYNDSFVEPEENTDSFEEPTESPETSDDIVPSMLFVIFGLSALAVIATLKSKKEAK